MIEELVVLVDETGKPTGTAEKLAVHHADTPLHLAFSSYIFDDKGRILVTRRALNKKVWPGVWTNTCCGHPGPNENIIDAIKRRLIYELGMTAHSFEVLIHDYTYRTTPYNGIIEHEYCPVYIGKAKSDPKPNSVEIEDWKWMSWSEFTREASVDNNDAWSWWCKDQLKQLINHPRIKAYTEPA